MQLSFSLEIASLLTFRLSSQNVLQSLRLSRLLATRLDFHLDVMLPRQMTLKAKR